MKFKTLIFSTLAIIILGIFSMSLALHKEKKMIPSERMYQSIIFYADSFEVPHYFAFNIAALETNYKGPLDTNYNHRQISKAGAMGPMQIMYRYSHSFAGRKVSKTELLDSIEFNVRLSMKIISEKYQKYGNWSKVAGSYNTGRPIINSYAIKASDSTFYQKRWIGSVEN